MKEYNFNSSDNKTVLHCSCWEPENPPKGVLMIVHGMCEYIGRYSHFAEYMASEGYVVCGHDHIGHGKSIASEDDYGFFGVPDGNDYLLKDMDMHVELLKQKYPDSKIFILGHSMGSFLTRQYICKFGDKLSGVIISGTGVQSGFNLFFGDLLTKLLSLFCGWKKRSKMIQLIAFGSYLKGIPNPRTTRDWLTRDEKIVDEYLNTKECMFRFTLNGFNQMFKSIKEAQNKLLINSIPDNLPIILMSGEKDPVGDFGKGVNKAFNLYKSAGKNVSLKLYKDDRHEIINELDKETVYKDMCDFLSECRGV